MWVLQCELATKKRNKPVYFGTMTAIGPTYTENIAEATNFKTKQEAMQCPAYYHPLCFFEPIVMLKTKILILDTETTGGIF